MRGGGLAEGRLGAGAAVDAVEAGVGRVGVVELLQAALAAVELPVLGRRRGPQGSELAVHGGGIYKTGFRAQTAAPGSMTAPRAVGLASGPRPARLITPAPPSRPGPEPGLPAAGRLSHGRGSCCP